MSDAARLCVVIPAFEEEDSIAHTVRAVAAALAEDGIEHEVLVVDDGSGDGTWAALGALREELGGRFRALRLSRNFGKDAAMFAGISAADADLVLTMDADGQHPPALIGELLAVHRRTGCDIVNGVKRGRRADKLFQRMTSALFNRIFRALSGLRLEDSSDFKLYTRRAVDALLACGDRYLFLRGLSRWIGFHQEEVLFDVPARFAGANKWRGSALLVYAINAMVLYSNVPLYLILLVGLLSLLVTLPITALLLWRYLFGEGVPDGYSTLLMVGLLTFSTVTIALGSIGLYLKGILVQAKDRPRYLVMDALDGGDA